MNYKPEHEQKLYDVVKFIHENYQYCMIKTRNIDEVHYCSYVFVNSCDIRIEYDYYDGWQCLTFHHDGFQFILGDEYFVFYKDIEHENGLFCSDSKLEIVDADSYFQYYLIEDLYNIRWQTFPLIAKIREVYFDQYYVKEILDQGFKFI